MCIEIADLSGNGTLEAGQGAFCRSLKNKRVLELSPLLPKGRLSVGVIDGQSFQVKTWQGLVKALDPKPHG